MRGPRHAAEQAVVEAHAVRAMERLRDWSRRAGASQPSGTTTRCSATRCYCSPPRSWPS
ncbi:hypothetical protein NKG94_33435 [Micromonospora sp. M12]